MTLFLEIAIPIVAIAMMLPVGLATPGLGHD